MKQILLATLGASDIQYSANKMQSANKRRLENYSKECKEIYDQLLHEEILNDPTYLLDIDFPLLSALLSYLMKSGKKIDKAILFYTLQGDKDPVDDPRHEYSRDTYWAYEVIKLLAEKTKYFGYQFKVEGIHVKGDPSNPLDMFSLYSDILTSEWLKEKGVEEEDILYGSFTGGTPAMTYNLIQAFSSLTYPYGGKEYYYIAMPKQGQVESQVYPAPIGDLFRQEEVMKLVVEMLKSRQFAEARKIIAHIKFHGLQEMNQDILHFIGSLHHRFLLSFEDSLQDLKRCRSEIKEEKFFRKNERQLNELVLLASKLDNGLVKKGTDVKLLIKEFYLKTLFYWEAELWNEFVTVSSSFYEWLLQLKYFEILGPELWKKGKKIKAQFQFLVSNKNELDYPLQIWVDEKQGAKIPISNRFVYKEVISLYFPNSRLISDKWGGRMEKLYTELRNDSIHQFKGTNAKEVQDILGKEWNHYTKITLREEFEITNFQDEFDELIKEFAFFLKMTIKKMTI